MKRGNGAGAAATLILACVFGATLLMSMVAGAGVYRDVESRVEAGAAQRVGLTYITSKIHGCDEQDAVRVGTFGGADAVYLSQPMDEATYQTILYVYEGNLMELFCEEGADLGPEAGQQIAQAQSLRASQTQPGLLHLEYTTADGRTSAADVYLRSGGSQ